MRLAVYPVKGGTGKTTLVLALAGAAAMRGLRVLVVDLDTGTSRATQSLLAGDRSEVGQVVAGKGAWYGVRVMRWDGVSALPDDLDLVLIDCPADPGRSAPAAAAADVILIPLPPEPFSVGGLADAHAALAPGDRSKVRVVVNAFDIRERLHREELQALRDGVGALLIPGVVPRRAAIPRAQSDLRPLQLTGVRGLEEVLPVIEIVLDDILGKGASR